MKSLVLTALFLAVTVAGTAQKVEQLEEAVISYAPMEVKISEDGDRYSYRVNEDYVGEFEENPIAFLKDNFDIAHFISQNEDEDYDSYLLTFRSTKGYLKANYDKEGKLERTTQRFEDIVLPLDVRRDLYVKNKGWNMVSNRYIATGNGDIIEKEIYKVKLENGNQKRTVKLDPREIKAGVAGNF